FRYDLSTGLRTGRRTIAVAVERGGQRGDRRCHLATVGGPALRFLLEHGHYERGDVGRKLGAEGVGWSGVLAEDLRQPAERMVGHEGGAAGQAFVEHAAEREDVDASIELAMTARLLGGHVAGCSDERARMGLRSRRAVSPRDAEIEQLGRLGVAMDE